MAQGLTNNELVTVKQNSDLLTIGYPDLKYLSRRQDLAIRIRERLKGSECELSLKTIKAILRGAYEMGPAGRARQLPDPSTRMLANAPASLASEKLYVQILGVLQMNPGADPISGRDLAAHLPDPKPENAVKKELREMVNAGMIKASRGRGYRICLTGFEALKAARPDVGRVDYETTEERKTRERMISDASEAQERLPLDELEEHARTRQDIDGNAQGDEQEFLQRFDRFHQMVEEKLERIAGGLYANMAQLLKQQQEQTR